MAGVCHTAVPHEGDAHGGWCMPPSVLLRLRKGTTPAPLGVGEHDVAWIESLRIIRIIVLGMPLEPGHGVLIVGMTGVAEDVHHALVPWHTATVFRRTGACACETAG